jgi:hypothetical protein
LHVLAAEAGVFGKQVGEAAVEGLLRFGVAPVAGDDVDEDDVVGAGDAEIVRVVDQLVRGELADELEAVSRCDSRGPSRRGALGSSARG